MTLDEFLASVDVGDADECWPWLKGRHGSDPKASYGKAAGVTAHRLSYQLHFGDPGRLHVLHRCDNPPCVNPAHLFLGTQADNNRDRDAKGRGVAPPHLVGEDHGMAVLTASAVALIRGPRILESSAALGREFGVSATRIRQIKAGDGWKGIA